MGVSWEAGIILKFFYGDQDITELDMLGHNWKQSTTCLQSSSSSSSDYGGLNAKMLSDLMPQFVEAMHIYSLLKHCSLFNNNNNGSTNKGNDTCIGRHPGNLIFD